MLPTGLPCLIDTISFFTQPCHLTRWYVPLMMFQIGQKGLLLGGRGVIKSNQVPEVYSGGRGVIGCKPRGVVRYNDCY